jgi:hypothetical protein
MGQQADHGPAMPGLPADDLPCVQAGGLLGELMIFLDGLIAIDVPVAGVRLRDKRNGFTIPPQLTVGTVIDALSRPAWWFNFLTTEPLAFAPLSRWSGTVAELLDTMFDPTVTYEDLAWIRSRWPGHQPDCSQLLRSSRRTGRRLGP